MTKELDRLLKSHGGAPSPFDCWLGNLGIKTFALRMERHCANAMAVAKYLSSHPKVADVRYPGLESHPNHAVAKKQMGPFGGMLAFELPDDVHTGVAELRLSGRYPTPELDDVIAFTVDLDQVQTTSSVEIDAPRLGTP